MTAASVVVCTRDRAALLGTTLRGALAEARTRGAELLVVDNASTDGTATLLADFAAQADGAVRVVHEPEVGLSAARNRALAEARGEVAVFLDDDAVPRPGWLAVLLAPYAEPGVGCVGGRILLAFATRPPSWLVPALHPAFSGYDPGDGPRRIRYGGRDWYPFGANVSFRVATARRLGGFSRHMGLRGGEQLQHEETDLCFRIDRAGEEIRYAPDAIVDHRILTDRLTPEWLLRRYRSGGRSAAIFILKNRGLLRALWRVRWLYGADLLARRYVPRAPVDAGRLVRECRRQEAVGYVVGLARALPLLGDLRREARTARPLGATAGTD